MARQLLLALSLAHSCACHSLHLEDWRGLSELTAIAADYPENLLRDETLAKALLCRLLQLLVKEPLVDLNPREAGDFHGMLALLAIQFSTRFEVDASEVLDLACVFTQAVGRTTHHTAVAAVLFAQAFA